MPTLRHRALRRRAPALLLTLGLTACSAPEDSHVAYKTVAPFGEWYDVPIHSMEEGVSTEPPAAGPADSSMAQGGQTAPAADGGMRDDDAGKNEGGAPGKPTGPDTPTRAPAVVEFTVSTRGQPDHQRAKPFDSKLDDDFARGPDNSGAIWITTDDGTFVRTVQAWGTKCAVSVVHYYEAKGGSRHSIEPDAVTSATPPPMYTAHDAVWKMVDRDNKPVPDGQYRLFVELADYDTDEVKAKAMGVSNALVEVPFDTTKRPQTITLKDTDYLFNMNLSVK